MAEAKWSGVLSTTEPRNDVGIMKVRQGNINSEIAEFQIVQNNKPYDLTGLTVYFCASFGLNLVEKPAVVINTTGGRIQYTFDDDSMQSVGRQKGYFSIKKAESKIDSTQEFEFQVESSLMTRSIDGKSYIYKLSTLIKVLDDFIKNGQNNFNTWFDSVKEILYGVDPGGNILRELIEARKNSSGNIFASLKARLDKNEDDTRAQMSQIRKDIKSYGAKGDGITNDSAAFRTFLSSGGNLAISSGVYMIDAEVFNLVSNTNLTFENRAKIKLLPHNTDSYSILQCLDVDNVKITNAFLDGSKSENQFAGSGEWGHGIDVLNSTNVTVDNPEVLNTFGDGIYVGHNYWGASTIETDTVNINNAIIDGARRNGISICGGRNLTIKDPHIKNVTETNPKAGIDIEPEGMGGVLPFLENLTITNPIIEGCYSGILLFLDNLKDRNKKVDITITNPKINNCNTPLSFINLTGELGGTIVYSDVQVKNAKDGVILMSEYKSENTPHILIDGITVDGFNTNLSTNDFYNHFLTIIGFPEKPTLFDVGNMTINNPIIKDSSNPYFKFIFASLQNSAKKIKKISIVNPQITTTKEITNFIRNNPEIKISDNLETLKKFSNYYQQNVDGSLLTSFDNKGATDFITVFSNDVNIPIGHRIKFRALSDFRLSIKPTTYIQGYTMPGGTLYSSTVGSTLALVFIGDRWIVESAFGTWVVE